MLWRVSGNRYYLDYVWRRHVEFPELLHSTKQLAETVRPDKILIEDKGAGSGLIQTLRDDNGGYPVIPYDPGQIDKVSRMRVRRTRSKAGSCSCRARPLGWKSF